jgi:hypothetical protein
LFNGKSTRQPNINEFIDVICERLHQAIEIYEKMPSSKMEFCLDLFSMLFLVNISNQGVEIDHESRKALNFIEAGRNTIFDV